MSLSKEVLAKVEDWLKYDKFEHSRKEIQKLVDEKDEATLKKRLMKRIAFGTAGLRAKMAAGFSCMNDLIIVQTTQALTKYLEEKVSNAKTRGIIIGYDHRSCNGYDSKRFAEVTALIFILAGFKVYLFSKIVPTPWVPYGVMTYNCAAGIMITASHNPKMDNGYKLYWENGSQIIPPHDSNIAKEIQKNLEIRKDVMDAIISGKITTIIHDAKNGVIDKFDELTQKYFEDIKKQYQWRSDDVNKKSTLKIVYTAMHGVGADFVKQAFKTFNLPPPIDVIQQSKPDPTFSTVAFPNPEEGKGSLKLAIETADKNDAKVIIANDPDADRLAVAEKTKDGWEPLNGNQIALLFADWVFRNYVKKFPKFPKKNFVMINSTVSSKILKGMSEIEGFSFEETLTGFKWIASKGIELTKKNMKFLLGYEVEIGFAIGDISFDKDGVRVSSIFAELANEIYGAGGTLYGHLDSLYKKYGYYGMRTKYFFVDTQERLKKVMKKIRELNNGSYPTSCGGVKVKYIRDLTRGYDNSQPNNKPKLWWSPSMEMITFTLEDNTSITIRASGTEPKLKWYCEVKEKDEKKAQEKVVKMSKAMIKEFLKPKENGLEAPKNWVLE